MALNNIDPERDARFTMGPMDVLDHSSPRVHVRLEDGDRRDAEAARGRIHARLAAGDRDGRRDEARGGCDVAVARHSGAMSATSADSQETREGQTFAGAIAALDVRELRQAAAHRVRAAVRAGRRRSSRRTSAPVTWAMLGWIVLAFTARALRGDGIQSDRRSRVSTRAIRARGMRELPRGALSVREAWPRSAIASAVFVSRRGVLNPLCAMLSPVALAWVFFYSYTKRFTRWRISCSGSACRSRRWAAISP